MSNGGEKIIYTMMRVSKVHQSRPVIKDISLSYFYGAKIGVLGLNGSGKSTLLRIMAGVDQEFDGKAMLSPGYTVGFLEQEPVLDQDKTVREIVEEGLQDVVDLVKEYNAISEKFAEPMDDDEMNALMERQGELQEKIDHLDAWDIESRLDMAMDALRCPPGRYARALLSGGERGGWPYAGCFSRSLTSCSWTSPRTTSMPRPWPGWSATSSSTPGPRSR
jgi:ATPase subunit of ABC transporter with duplicated ATPase domains